MSTKSGQAITVLFSTANASTGAATDATGTPTGTLYVNGTANGATVTVTNITTGLYKAAVTLPSLSAGDVVSLRAAATVATVAGEGVIWQEVADTERTSDLNDLSAAQVNAEVDTALADYDGPTNAEMVARTLVAANYFDPATDTVANVTAVGSVTGAVGSVTGAVGSVTGNVGGNVTGSVGSVAAGGITAASIATNAIDADAIAADAVTEIQSGLATAASLATVAGYIDTEVASILAAVDTEVAAIKAKTDNLPAAPAATGDIPTAAANADAVWDEILAGHVAAGSTGEALGAAGSAGDPWVTALPGAYGAGSAGKILGDNLNATVGSRATQTSVDDIPTNAELAAAIAAGDDPTLAAIAALNNLSSAQAQTAATAALNAYDPPTKAELDSAVAPLATQVSVNDIPTNAELAVALAAADDAVLAAIAALNNLSQAGAQAGAAAALAAYGAATAGDVSGLNDLSTADILAMAYEGAETLQAYLRLSRAALVGKATGGGTANIAFRDAADTKDRIVATVDADGNRSAIVTDAS